MLIADRFELVRSVGNGAGGVVYEALDRHSGAPVAVKVLRGDDGGVMRQRFFREAEVLEQLEHPAIVRYIAHGIAPGGNPYLVMEWLAGTTLAQRVATAVLSVSDALRVASRMASALACVHGRDVVHRDVKPSNVVLEFGRIDSVRLVDFGIARAAGLSNRLTMTGEILGTPGFMAPEQIRGERLVDNRADLFSLGALLFYCLVGRAPFGRGDLISVLRASLRDRAPRLRDLRDDVPGALDELVAGLLSFDPNARPASAEEVRTELRLAGTEMQGGASGLYPACPFATTLVG